MKRFDWGAEQDEAPEDIEAALATVRREGAKKKVKRRTVAASSLGTTALVVIVAAFSLNGAGSSTPSVDLVTKVTQTAAAALAEVKSVSATERFSSNDPEVTVPADYTGMTYRLAEDGSYFMTYSGTDEEGKQTYQEAYSATTGKTERCTELAGHVPDCVVVFQPGPVFKPMFRTFANIIDAASRSEGATAVSLKVGDRKAWRVEFDNNTPFLMTVIEEHVIVLVDQETGLPFHYEITPEDQPSFEITVNDIKTNVAFPAADMKVVRPAGATVHDGSAESVSEEGMVFGKTLSPAGAGRLPTASVSGWTSNETWTGAHAVFAWHGTCGDSTLYADSLLRKGLLTANLEVIDFSQCPEEKLDMQKELGEVPPVLRLPGFEPVSRLAKSFTATRGALQGTTFEIYSTGQGQYAMGGQSATTRVFVDGNLGPDELTELANSFRL
jgi:hypothetical protein